ncbi:PEP-CTERM sorting domain-containing protein [Arsukibacterium sp.]|uniref:PEP-CTERM sorting domain-containing protein n=1 Tax=Arsukibacterium sp. TaxID=1977258 RepID=UPI001BD1FBAA|nr:PEP-CTERM sorting domain-containing protein [Arsukibacterium sp.]
MKNVKAVLLFLTLASSQLFFLVYSVTAEAGLVRNAGKGSISVSFPTWVTMVPETELVSGLLREEYYAAGVPLAIRGPGEYDISAVPEEDCIVYLDGNTPFEDDPCYWQFYQDEALDLFGYTQSFFAEAQSLLSWTISNGADSWLFSGADVAVEEGAALQARREIYMNAAMPAGLLPGEYTLRASLDITAPEGYVFYNIDTLVSGPACIDELGGCFRLGTAVGNSRLVTSDPERFVVLPLAVPEPATLSLFSLLLLMLYRQSRRG